MHRIKTILGRPRLNAFLRGAASAFDIGGALPAVRISAIDHHRTVADALASDWKRVGGDLNKAIDVERASVTQR